MEQIISVKGMTCSGCEQKISTRLRQLPGVIDAVASRTNNTVTIKSDRNVSNEEIQKALSEIGSYTVVPEDKRFDVSAYAPLVAVIGYIVGATILLLFSSEDRSWHRGMDFFMGSFFVAFSLFKMLDIRGFADGFATYDLIAKRFRIYALSYPFIELGLGVLYLLGLFSLTTNALTLVIMSISFIGVARSLIKGSLFQCACLGTVLKLPLSRITLLEDGIMASMAFISVVNAI